MKKTLFIIFGILFSIQLSAQNFTGQWKGRFTDNSTSFVGWGGDQCDYVLELDCKGNNVTGYSYTYFNEGSRRYYTICKLKGRLNKATKAIEVTETERTKTNVPNNIRNCFQVHRLSFTQQGEDQVLEGTWVPAPNQEGDCGYGTTTLSRRILQKNPLILKNPLVKNTKPLNKVPLKATETVKSKVSVQPTVKEQKKIVVPVKPLVKTNPVIIEENINKTVTPEINKISIQPRIITSSNLEKRNNTLLKTIEIENQTFQVDLYDNGDIDGDSISLFFNGRLLLEHKRLGNKAITLTLKADDIKDVNELVMYAENLGEIPPNTALMIVTDGVNRYEVRISSDLQKSGVIRFIYKPKNGQ